MRQVKMFYLTGCPYCKQAFRALEELTAEDPAYAEVPVEKIEENQHADIADRYDYYHVPAMFVDEKKLYEAHPGEKYEECKAQVRRVLDAALGREEGAAPEREGAKTGAFAAGAAAGLNILAAAMKKQNKSTPEAEAEEKDKVSHRAGKF